METAHGVGEVDLICLPPSTGLVCVLDHLDRQTRGMLEVDEPLSEPLASGSRDGRPCAGSGDPARMEAFRDLPCRQWPESGPNPSGPLPCDRETWSWPFPARPFRWRNRGGSERSGRQTEWSV